jgi:uncharacterized phage infection (PIP) family protein YhgE
MNDTSSMGRNSPGNKPQGVSGKKTGSASSAMGDLTGQVGNAAGEVAREAKEQAANLTDTAKGLAEKAGEKLLNTVEEQKAAGADLVSGMASAIRRAAGEFDRELPQAGQYIRMAADQIDSVSDSFRRRDVNQLVADVHGFARRQPTAVLGAAVLAGFAVVRFFKSSTAGAAGQVGGQGIRQPVRSGMESAPSSHSFSDYPGGLGH